MSTPIEEGGQVIKIKVAKNVDSIPGNLEKLGQLGQEFCVRKARSARIGELGR